MDFNKRHLIFSVENPMHQAKVKAPTHDEAISWLRQQGEDAHSAVGHYDGNPERSIIVNNPKNIKGIEQLAEDIGQDSILHSHNGNHELKYLNGQNKGKVVKGSGTKIHSSAPPDMFTTINDHMGDPVHFTHNLDFGKIENPSLSKSEDLLKAPLRYTDYDPYIAEEQGLPDFMNHEHYKHIKSVELPNGLEYRKFKHKLYDHNSKMAHAIYDPKNEHEPMAYMETEIEDPEVNKKASPSVSWSEVSPDHKGKGLGRQLYLATLAFGTNKLQSDTRISPDAHKMWQSFKTYPGLSGKISKYPTDEEMGQFSTDPKFARQAEEPHHVFVSDKSKLDFNKMFPSITKLPIQKLAASEQSDDEFLFKSVDDKTWKQVSEYHNKAVVKGNDVVDSTGHINYFNKKHSDYNSALEHKDNMTRVGNPGNAVSPKMLHNVNGQVYMAKPYHTPNERWAAKMAKHPIRGWASLTTNRLFNAAGMKQNTEDISAHIHNGVPIVVHKFNTQAQDTDQNPPLNMKDHAKLGIIDFLSNNQDRHASNLMHVHGMPFAIDHDRNFQYFEAKPGFNHMINPENSYQHQPAYGRNIKKNFDMFADDLTDWWNNHGENIKNEMKRNLEFIKDPAVKQHIGDNFKNRWEWLDDRFRNDPYQVFNSDGYGADIVTYKKPKKIKG